MHANNLVLNDGCDWQVVKGIGEQLPHLWATIGSHAFIKEAIDLRDLATLVVSSQDSDALLKADFVQEHQRHRLHGVVAAVHIVPQEQIVGLWQWTSNAKQLFEVQELAVDVSANGDRATNWLAVRLFL